jgi:hypothetical protein
MAGGLKLSKLYYSMFARWLADDESPATMGARFLNTLDQLGPVDQAMSNWMFLDTVNYVVVPMAEVRPTITAFTEHNVSRDDYGEPDPREGYYLAARGAKIPSEFGTPQTVQVTVDAGSQWINQASFEVGAIGCPPDLALVTYPIYRRALEILASIWPCPWVDAYVFAPNFPPLEPGVATPIEGGPRFRDIWISYLSPSLAAGFAPPADLVCERTPGGGLILSAVQERLDPANPEHMRRSSLLQEIMIERAGEDEHPARVGPY